MCSFRKLLILLYLSISVPGFIDAQSLHKISGQVLDAETGAPIVGASVVVVQTKKGTTTDVEGRFFLQLPSGSTFSIQIGSVR